MGLIVLKTDETMEVELRGLFEAATLACYHSRIPMRPTITPETLADILHRYATRERRFGGVS